ncbi:MAG TPA: hypothetical protein VJ757_15955 [Pseudonocardiaceae bacterium]|nr:hypothetical protein [Pseudonocardiaceae bacterium]
MPGGVGQNLRTSVGGLSSACIHKKEISFYATYSMIGAQQRFQPAWSIWLTWLGVM